MEQCIGIAAVALIVAYVVCAIGVICTRETVAGSVSASAGFLGGSFVIIPVAECIATIVCWGIAIGLILLVAACIFD